MAPSKKQTVPDHLTTTRSLPPSPNTRYIATGYVDDDVELLRRSDEVKFESSDLGRSEGYRAPFYSRPMIKKPVTLPAKDRTLNEVETDLLAALVHEKQERLQRDRVNAVLIPGNDEDSFPPPPPRTPRQQEILTPAGIGMRSVQSNAQLLSPPSSSENCIFHLSPSTGYDTTVKLSVPTTIHGKRKIEAPASLDAPNKRAQSIGASYPPQQPQMRQRNASRAPMMVQHAPMMASHVPIMSSPAQDQALVALFPEVPGPWGQNAPPTPHFIPRQREYMPATLPPNFNHQQYEPQLPAGLRQIFLTQRLQLHNQHQKEIDATSAHYGTQHAVMPNHPLQHVYARQRGVRERLGAQQRECFHSWRQVAVARQHAQFLQSQGYRR